MPPSIPAATPSSRCGTVSDHDIEVGGLRNDILAKYGDLAAYNPQIPYDYIVYYGTSLTPSKEFA